MKNINGLSRFVTRLFLLAAFVLAATTGFTGTAAAATNDNGFVYTQSNAASGNAILAYARASNGKLYFRGQFATGGLGSGAGLGSQGALALTEDNRWLLAVNAGSNQISVFAVKPTSLKLMSVVDSNGQMPISLTVHDETVYVLNGGGSGNISGFSLDDHGMLSALNGSTQNLSNGGVGAAPGGAEIAFTPAGDNLVVTEKATNLIDTFRVQGGIASPAVTHASSGATPFGFAFNDLGTLVVSEAFGGAPGASALSSYRVHNDTFNLISPSVHTTQTAACWVAISKNGKFAYTTNAGSGTISSYTIAGDGSIKLLNATAGSTGAGSSPIDLAFSNNGAYLYALSAAGHTISAFRMQSNGSLVAVGTFSVPAGALGLAAR
ncbi:MAG TPA: beta-propeller fold lactonase family protein [Anaerolineales bacterium]|jgi:6-phosphogluconolactonase (cycloisomerase 2 family)